MAIQTRVTLSLPAGTVRRLDRAAAGARRSRSNAAAVLIDHALAGRQRLAELGELASEADTRDTVAEAAQQAAAEHLERHAALSGITPPEAA